MNTPSGAIAPSQGTPKQQPTSSVLGLVYSRCMARTNVDIDDMACAEVMQRYQLGTKRAAINFALRTLAAEPLSLDEARALRGTGWEGDLDEMRSDRIT